MWHEKSQCFNVARNCHDEFFNFFRQVENRQGEGWGRSLFYFIAVYMSALYEVGFCYVYLKIYDFSLKVIVFVCVFVCTAPVFDHFLATFGGGSTFSLVSR